MLLFLRTLLLSFALLTLAACGGGSDGDTTPPPNDDGGGNDNDDDNDDGSDDDDGTGDDEPTAGSRTGTFVDSAVAGITFTNQPSGITGTTDAQGRFTFEPGDEVTFSIGDLSLPPTTARGVVTPLTIAGTDEPTDVVATNIARLLQTLDFDGDASNGIDIASGAAEVATAVDFSADDFDAQVADLVANSGSSNTTLVSAEDAQAHLQASIADVRDQAVGSWYYVDTSAANVEEQFVIVLTLFADGRFAIFNDEDWPEMDGFEVGDIDWNINNGQVTLSNVRDYNGEIGLSGGTCASEEDSLFTFDLVTGATPGDDKLLLGADTGVGENCDEAEGDGNVVIEFSRLYSDTDGRVGTWFMEDADEFLLLHLFADGMFAYLEEDTDPQTLSAGIERGSYSIEAETNAVTWTVETDTNGDSGFSHPCPDLSAGETTCGPDGGDIVETLTFDADNNALVFGTNDPAEEPEAFSRIGPTGVEVGTSGDSGSGDDTALDISGTWTFEINDSTEVAECEDDRTENFVVVQTGTDLEVTDEGGHSYSGSLSGDALVWSGSYPEDGGTSETSLEATVAVDSNGAMSMSGSSSWSFTLDGETDPYCSGTSTFTGTLN
ncbi:hypothetical protein OOT55_15065 [Marinimicrobium sp. C6131]|uniref:hypothetical protein n=1 Tax=Marinimicrobium sp. C6131 TaxID=3022676 RepID=UPI00223E5988|nr:hypothetical protein [Marinimicrobium sp. C6131]UZJ43963.1 hypothetical protein OOT55_15065 [Marinimicrobium sp. C6131]